MSKLSTDSAEAFLGYAKQYHLAAVTLFPLGKQVEAPLYFLFSHTLELAFKAFIRSFGSPALRANVRETPSLLSSL